MIDHFADATAQAELVRRGEVSPSELVEATVQRIEKLDPQLNSVVIPLFGKGRAEAVAAPCGPFHGVPYLLKDLTMMSAGDPFTAGVSGLKAAGYRADHDSHFVRRMRAAGFVLLGRTNTPELGLAATTEPRAWGPTRNPWNLAHSTGGSSGGSAAAVAAGLVPVAHGNDGGGSIRMPAAQCGVVGLRPSRGRVSQGPMVQDSDNVSGMTADMCLTRSVRDLAATLDIVSGHAPGDAYCAPPPLRPYVAEVGADPGRLRIGVLTHDPAGDVDIHPDCVTSSRAVAEVLSRLGHDVADGFPQVLAEGAWPLDFVPCIAVVVRRELEHFGRLVGRPLTQADVEPATWDFARRAGDVSGAQYAAGVDSLRVQARETERWWHEQGWDLLITPTMPCPSPLLGQVGSGTDPFLMNLEIFTVPYNVSGQPAVSLPLGMSGEGLPLGIQLVAAYGREDLLIRVASQLETALPWAHRRPPIG